MYSKNIWESRSWYAKLLYIVDLAMLAHTNDTRTGIEFLYPKRQQKLQRNNIIMYEFFGSFVFLFFNTSCSLHIHPYSSIYIMVFFLTLSVQRAADTPIYTPWIFRYRVFSKLFYFLPLLLSFPTLLHTRMYHVHAFTCVNCA